MTSKRNSAQTDIPSATQDMGEYYIDPVDEWLTEQSKEWAEKYQGKYLAIVDCDVVGVENTIDAAFKAFESYPDKTPFVWYVPMEEEIKHSLLSPFSLHVQ